MDKNYPHPFKTIKENVRAMRRKLPLEVSNIAVNEFKYNFRLGGYRSDAGVIFWRKRKSNINAGRAILVKSGRLKRGLQTKSSYDYAWVINPVPYAKAHNEGFTGMVTVKYHKRRKYKSAKVKYKTAKGKTRNKTGKSVSNTYTVRSFKRKMNLPARPFMITGRPLLNNIEKHFFDRLNAIYNKA